MSLDGHANVSVNIHVNLFLLCKIGEKKKTINLVKRMYNVTAAWGGSDLDSGEWLYYSSPQL